MPQIQIILDSPTPTKLHLPIVCVVIALSNKRLDLVFALLVPKYHSQHWNSSHWSTVLVMHRATSFKYIDEGVKNSADSVALKGVRFGGSDSVAVPARTLRTVPRDGSTERDILDGGRGRTLDRLSRRSMVREIQSSLLLSSLFFMIRLWPSLLFRVIKDVERQQRRSN